MNPQEYFTDARLEDRTPNRVGTYVFYFCEGEDAWPVLMRNQIKIGHEGLLVSEDPSVRHPGQFVFVLDTRCLIKLGFSLLPTDNFTRAEWRVVESHFAEREGIPLTCIAFFGAWGGIWGFKRPSGKKAWIEAARESGLEFEEYNWTDWWNDGPIRRG